MEARVAKLESHVEYIRSDVSTLKSDVKTIAGDIVEMKIGAVSMDSRLKNIEENMVTKGQLAIWALLMVLTGAGTVVGGGWWIVQQYLSPILRAMPK